MADPTDSDRIAYTMGEVHALKAVLHALLGTHPNPRMALRDIEASLQSSLATIEAIAIPEIGLEGYQRTSAEFLRAARTLAGS